MEARRLQAKEQQMSAEGRNIERDGGTGETRRVVRYCRELGCRAKGAESTPEQTDDRARELAVTVRRLMIKFPLSADTRATSARRSGRGRACPREQDWARRMDGVRGERGVPVARCGARELGQAAQVSRGSHDLLAKLRRLGRPLEKATPKNY